MYCSIDNWQLLALERYEIGEEKWKIEKDFDEIKKYKVQITKNLPSEKEINWKEIK